MKTFALYGVPGKMTRRLLAVVIGTQGLAVFFGALVARSLAAAQDSPTSGRWLLVGSLLAVLCILDAGLIRLPWGVTLGWVLQVATLACALVVPLMLPVGLLFGGLWITSLVQGRRMDEHTREVDARWHAKQWHPEQERSAPDTSAGERSAPEAPEPER